MNYKKPLKRFTPVFLLLILSFFLQTQAQTPQLWGVTSTGAANGNGSVIKINEDGNAFEEPYSFVDSTGSSPQGNFVKTANGILYGMANTGGTNGEGVIFSFNPSGNIYTDLYNFLDTISGANPYGSLTLSADGNLYGMTHFGGNKGFGVIFRFNPSTNIYSDLYNFNDTLGGLPYGNLLQVNDSIFYGMTSFGGDTALNSGQGCGVIFSFNILDSNYTMLHEFNFSDGAFPRGSLVHVSNGKLYGMTAQGGIDSAGILFSIATNGSNYTNLHNFTSATGTVPFGTLIQANNDSLYGMTYSGGAKNEGVIFSIDTLGKSYSDIHDFDTTHGANPYGSLTQASNDNLYGMTYYGGANSAGTLFSFETGTNSFTKLYDFADTTGVNPYGDLIEMPANTGINRLSAIDFHYSIFPNPATNQLTVISNQLSVNEISIETILGQRVFEKTINAPLGITGKQIDVSNLPAGMYFITITALNQTTTKKFLVIK